MQRLGVLTSGGDAPGMNAAIRAIVRKAIYDHYDIYGIRYGFKGLAEGELGQMTIDDVGDLLAKGGTVLGTMRYPEFKDVAGQKLALENLQRSQLDALIVIGGNGSLKGAHALAAWDFPTVAIPATIDNDVPGTDIAIGFDTAVNTAIAALDKIRDTASSHERTFIVEVMGRHAGDIALWTGIGSGAEQVIIPEQAFNMEEVVQEIHSGRSRGKKHIIIILAEGVMAAHEFKAQLEAYGNFHTRVSVLGHTQRGGSPSARDRVLASVFGYKAVELLSQGKSNVCLGLRQGEVVYQPLTEALAQAERVPWMDLYDINNEISF